MVTELVFTGLPFIFTPVNTLFTEVPPVAPLATIKLVGVAVKLPPPMVICEVTDWQLLLPLRRSQTV